MFILKNVDIQYFSICQYCLFLQSQKHLMKENNENKYTEIQSVLDAIEVIGGKWKFPIIYSLCDHTKRFKELENELKGISPKALSNALKDLEMNGLIHREVFPTVPVTVEYSLTPYGKDLKPVLSALQEWGKKHREKIVESCKEKN